MSNETQVRYGSIIVYVDENNEYKFLITKRRDTISYFLFFIKYLDINELNMHLKRMTYSEKKRILEYKNNFNELWKDVHFNENKDIDLKAEKIFNYNLNKCENLLNLFSEKNSKLDNDWSFSKGHIAKNELPINCSLRELKEELHISKEKLIFPKKNIIVSETMIGFNNVRYTTYYYVFLTKNEISIPKINCPNLIRTNSISNEIEEYKWCTLSEAKNNLLLCRIKMLENVTKSLSEK